MCYFLVLVPLQKIRYLFSLLPVVIYSTYLTQNFAHPSQGSFQKRITPVDKEAPQEHLHHQHTKWVVIVKDHCTPLC